MSQKYLLVKYWYDFLFDGYKIVRLEDITEVIQEKFVEKIHEREKIVANNELTAPINIDGWQQIFCGFLFSNMVISIECEHIDGVIFYLGKILGATASSVEILQFDGEGKWDECKTMVEFQDITCISFNSRYIKIMSKYTEPYRYTCIK
jgi:tetrahydromethanopterin S-methyltransferase subunit F